MGSPSVGPPSASRNELQKRIQPTQQVAKPQLSPPRGGQEAGSRARAGCKPCVAQEPPTAHPRSQRGVPQPRLQPTHAGPDTGVQEHEAAPRNVSVLAEGQPGVPKPGSSSRGYLRDAAVVCVQPSPAGTARPELEPSAPVPGHQATVLGWPPARGHLPAGYASSSACISTGLTTAVTQK